ncbi:hypothetical protein EV363DRAFT_1150820, partial [Boletus edulis]
RGSLITQNNAAPPIWPRRCLDCASTRPRSPSPPPTITCMPSPRPMCTDANVHSPPPPSRHACPICPTSHLLHTLPSPLPCPHVLTTATS